jgi:hypothetical protein
MTPSRGIRRTKVQATRERVKRGGLRLENSKLERVEAEKAVKLAKVDEDDGKLVPLYDWYVICTRTREYA